MNYDGPRQSEDLSTGQIYLLILLVPFALLAALSLAWHDAFGYAALWLLVGGPLTIVGYIMLDRRMQGGTHGRD